MSQGGPRRRGGGGSDDREEEEDSTSASSSTSGNDQLHGGQAGEDDSTSGTGGTAGGGRPSGGSSGSDELHGGQVVEDDSTRGAGGTAGDSSSGETSEPSDVGGSEGGDQPTDPSQSSTGLRMRQGNSDGASTVGRGPGGTTVTDYDLYGEREDPPPARDDGPDELHGGQVNETDSTSGATGDNYSGIEDNIRERTHRGLEEADEEDLQGLEDRDDLDPAVETAVGDFEAQIQSQHPGLDADDYAIRRNDGRLTVAIDEAAVASQIADRVVEENPNLDRGDFAVRRDDDGGFHVEYGEHTGELEAVQELEQQVRERYPTIREDQFAIRETEDGGYQVDIDPGFQASAVADRFERSSGLERGDHFVVEADDGEVAVEVTEAGRKERYRQQVAASDPTIESEDIVVEDRNVDPDRLRPAELKHYVENPYKVRYSDEYLQEQAREQIAEQTEADADDFDVHVSDGEVSVAFDEEYRRQRVREQVAAENDRIDEDDIAQVVTRGPESVDELTAGQTASVAYGVELTEDAQREILEERAREEYPDAEISVVENDEGELVAQVDGENQERFGDVAIPVPGTDKRVEDYLEAGAQGWSEAAGGFAEGVAVPLTLTEGLVNVDIKELGGRSVGDVIGDATTNAVEGTAAEGGVNYVADQMAPREDDDGIQASGGEGFAERSAEGFVSGVGNIVNLPGLAAGLKEAGEYGGYAVYETAQGRAGVDVSIEEGDPDLSERQAPVGPNMQTGRPAMVDVDVLDDGLVGESGRAAESAARAGANYIAENLFEGLGKAAGSLVGSYGAIRGASKVSTRAGRGAAWAIQPGEEALTSAVNRLPGASRVAQRFPNNRIDNEEIFIRAGQKATRRLRQSVEDPQLRYYLAAGARAVREGSPRVRVVRDPDAGLFDIDPELRARARDRVPSSRGQGESITGSVREMVSDAPGRVSSGVSDQIEALRDAPQAVRSGAVSGRESVQRGLGNARQAMDDAAYDAGYRAGRWTGQSISRGERILRDVRNGEIDFDDIQNPSFDPFASAERAGYRVGQRTAAGFDRLDDIRAAPRRYATAARFDLAEARANTPSSRTELRAAAGESLPDVEDVLDDVVQTPRRYATAARFDLVEARENIASMRTNLSGSSRESLPDLDEAVRTPRRYATAARFDVSEGLARTSSSVRAARLRVSQLMSSAGSAPAETRTALGDLRDLTIRVEPSDGPSSRAMDVDADDLEGMEFGEFETEVDFEPTSDSESQFETDEDLEDRDLWSEWSGDQSLTRQGVGTDSMQRLDTEAALEYETRPAESPTETTGTGETGFSGRAETFLAEEEDILDSVVASEAGLDETMLEDVEEPSFDAAVAEEPRVDEVGTEPRQSFEQESAFSPEFESEMELSQELEQELQMEQEFEFEQEFEMEAETEAETEMEGNRDPRSNEDLFGETPMDAEVWETGFASADELLDEASEGGDLFDEEVL